jgi:hypothetical protein
VITIVACCRSTCKFMRRGHLREHPHLPHLVHRNRGPKAKALNIVTSALAALRSCLGSAVCHRAGAVPVHRRTSFAPLLSLPARPQRSRDRPLHPVDRVVEWVHRPRSLLHGLRRSSPLHRAYRVNSPANATRHKQPGQKSHPPALPRRKTDAERRSALLCRRLNPPRG